MSISRPPANPPGARMLPVSTDWILAAVIIAGLTVMLVAIGSSSRPAATGTTGSRMAVGMTPTEGAVRVRINLCGPETVTTVSLRTVEPELTLWEAIAIEPADRDVFVVGQPPVTFVETVTMIEGLPRGVLLEATITTDEPYSVEFFLADLLPDLWIYGGSYYPDEAIVQAIETDAGCPGGVTQATSGRRIMMVVGFLIAAAAGAALMSRRIVSSGI